jgi:hypothetical protein
MLKSALEILSKRVIPLTASKNNDDCVRSRDESIGTPLDPPLFFWWTIYLICNRFAVLRNAANAKSLKQTLKGQCYKIFASGFFHESVSPQLQSIPLGPFQIFSKIRGDICKSRCTTSINDTSGKFATGINDTDGKFCHQFC